MLCYELSDQGALTLHQVKAHDVRAFASSKAFRSGISFVISLSPEIPQHLHKVSFESCGLGWFRAPSIPGEPLKKFLAFSTEKPFFLSFFQEKTFLKNEKWRENIF